MNRPVLVKEAITALAFLFLCYWGYTQYLAQTKWIGSMVVSEHGKKEEGIIIIPNLILGMTKDMKIVVQNTGGQARP